nr:EOG090X07AI [Triops cancriformis]
MSTISSTGKHIVHCFALITTISGFAFFGSYPFDKEKETVVLFDPWVAYGSFGCIFLYLCRSLVILGLPQTFFNFCGLVFYNAFPGKPQLRELPVKLPLICIRVVTRGNYPDLVRRNVERNMNTCLDSGLDNFLIEVVTDKSIGLPTNARTREVVVPAEYRTKSGVLFKGRALQYALEEGVNMLSDCDWIVHLDEETLLTESSVKGIVKFALADKHSFGQGLITYGNENVVNWLLTLSDVYRSADDMGKLRFQLSFFHKPFYGWKGSFVVSKVQAERKVSFDNGIDSSVAEDCFFSLMAYSKGYSFDFVEGEMWEKSPFNVWDFLRQRKRWLQGILLTAHSPLIPLWYKPLILLSIYSWVTLPLATSNVFLTPMYPIPMPHWFDLVTFFVAGVNMYMYLYGVWISFSIARLGCVRFMLCLAAGVITTPLKIYLLVVKSGHYVKTASRTS